MSTLRLSPTSYVMLGMIALRGPSTPYQLKRAASHSVGHFWTFPHSQFYDEPARLAAAGLLEETQEAIGRRRRTYSISQDGLRALRQWLADPGAGPMEVRDVAELKLFFSELGTSNDIALLATHQADRLRHRLAELEAIGQRFADRPDRARRLITLELGRRLHRAAIGFWTELAENPLRSPETVAGPQSSGAT